MPDLQLVLTPEEKEYLVKHLEYALRGERVEMRHTDARAYREILKTEIALVENLVEKLKRLT